MEPPKFLTYLPNHLWDNLVFPKLYAKDLARLGQACKSLYKKINESTDIWKALYLYSNLNRNPSVSGNWKMRVVNQELIKRNLRCENIHRRVFNPSGVSTFNRILCEDVLYVVKNNHLFRYVSENDVEIVPFSDENTQELKIAPCDGFHCVALIPGQKLGIWNKTACVFQINHYKRSHKFYDDLLFFVDHAENIQIWNYKTNLLLKMIPSFCEIDRLEGANERKLIIVTKNNTIVIYDIKTDATRTINLSGHQGLILFQNSLILVQDTQTNTGTWYSCETGLPITYLPRKMNYDDRFLYRLNDQMEIERRDLHTGVLLNKRLVKVKSIQHAMGDFLHCKTDEGFVICDKLTLEVLREFKCHLKGVVGSWDGLFCLDHYNRQLSRHEFHFWDLQTGEKFPLVGESSGGDRDLTGFGYIGAHVYNRDENKTHLISLMAPLPEKRSWFNAWNPLSFFYRRY